MDSGTPDEPDGPAVDRVRSELARLGDDATAAPDVPPCVTERVVSALRAAPPPQADRRSTVRFGAAVGVTAAVAAAGLGTVMLMRSEEPGRTSAQHLTTEPPPATVPLSGAEILALLNRRPELGALDDPRRRSSCLSGLGYPGSAAVLGGQQVEIGGQPAVLLVLPGDAPDTLAALAVRPNCSSADTGLLANTQIRRA